MIEPERTPYGDVFLIIGIFAAIFMLMVFYVAANQEPEPVPDLVVVTIAPTEIPTTAPTPTPVPTESQQELMARTNGYRMREWLHWFRPDVTGINTTLGSKDLSAWVSVYDYLFMPNYHYHSVSWGTQAFFKESPEPGMKFLFFFVNYYTDGDDVRPYIFDCSRFAVHANGIAYYPEDIYNPDFQIRELDNYVLYDKVTNANVPYGYKIVQDSPSGIRRAEKQEFIYGGRSNAIDGYCVVQVPTYESTANITVHGAFSNLGGQAWWQLE